MVPVDHSPSKGASDHTVLRDVYSSEGAKRRLCFAAVLSLSLGIGANSTIFSFATASSCARCISAAERW